LEFALIETGRLGGTFLVHDADWQTPAITEAHAYCRAFESMPAAPGVTYLAFPWATLIDQIQQGRDSSRLQEALDELAVVARGYDRVVTVCQHVFMGLCGPLFREAGVTDIFWAHARKGPVGQGFDDIRIAPFPLFPVNSPGQEARFVQKRHLFSFVGARPNPFYMDDARPIIFEELSDVASGLVISRDEWHFHQTVYEHQIRQTVASTEDPLANAAAAEYRQVMAESVFVLCPSGTGPNSLRLWEAIDCGAIPVIVSPLYEPPGDQALWRHGTLSADGSRDALRRLPLILERLAADEERLCRMRGLIGEIRARYGAENFVHDIVAFSRSLTAHRNAA
jgi:hypothetical protein